MSLTVSLWKTWTYKILMSHNSSMLSSLFIESLRIAIKFCLPQHSMKNAFLKHVITPIIPWAVTMCKCTLPSAQLKVFVLTGGTRPKENAVRRTSRHIFTYHTSHSYANGTCQSKHMSSKDGIDAFRNLSSAIFQSLLLI